MCLFTGLLPHFTDPSSDHWWVQSSNYIISFLIVFFIELFDLRIWRTWQKNMCLGVPQTKVKEEESWRYEHIFVQLVFKHTCMKTSLGLFSQICLSPQLFFTICSDVYINVPRVICVQDCLEWVAGEFQWEIWTRWISRAGSTERKRGKGFWGWNGRSIGLCWRKPLCTGTQIRWWVLWMLIFALLFNTFCQHDTFFWYEIWIFYCYLYSSLGNVKCANTRRIHHIHHHIAVFLVNSQDPKREKYLI